MRSTAHFKGHPLHPALIPFPFALLVAAALFDLAASIFGPTTFAATARHLTVAGLVAGVIAAIPGIIDYRNSVPPRSSGKRRARQHGLLNATALAAFALALALRGTVSQVLVTAIELLGAGLLAYSGWLGGVLVNRNLIGVDHRYANAGKWKELRLEPKPQPLVVAAEDELETGQMKLLHIGERRIALGRTERGYVAFDDHCTHRGGTLAGGVLIGTTVQCLWHGSQFDVETGAVRCGPAEQGISCYRVEIRNGQVTLQI
jgi:nitrite reductase/ring-hydroxylating ferredoxin subunit/uncharacterized membrane protein